MDKLAAAARGPRSEWKWAEAVLEIDWNATSRYGRVYPEPGEATEEEGAEIKRLRTRHDELANLDEDDWTDELIAEGEAIEERLGELETAINTRAAYHPERKAVAGCLVTIGHNGELRVEEGLVKPEDVPEAGRTSSEDGDPFSSAVMPPPAAPPDPAAVARKRVGVGAGLADDLRAVRTGIVKSRLAEDFGAAFDLLLFQLARGVFANGYRADALDIAVRETVDRPMGRGSGDGFPEFDERERLLAEDRAALSLGWMDEEDDGDAFAKLRALSESAKQRLFASCVARTVIGQLAFEPSVRPELEAAIARLDIDFAERFRPSADLFWSRITKARILEIARAALGPAWAQAHAKSRKPELAKAMERAFAVGESVPCGITSLARTKALAWTPPGIEAFDACGDDDSEGRAGDGGPEPDNAIESGTAGTDAGATATPEGQAGSERAAEGTAPPEPQPAPAGEFGDLAAEIAAFNAVPTADGGPRVIIRTVGFEDSTSAGPEPEGDDAEEIPAFLRHVE